MSYAAPPLLFPSAHIHRDSSLCSRIAIRGTQPTSTSLTGLSALIRPNATLQTPQVTAGECFCWEVSRVKWPLESSWWEGGWFGISGRLQENEWRKGKEATNSLVSRDFVCLPVQNVVLRNADTHTACVCLGASSGALNYSLIDESILEWIFVGSMSYPAALRWCNILINNE